MLYELKNIKKDYLLPDGINTLKVLDNITLNIDRGESIAVTGPSGSGKSTFLNILGALDKPGSGTILFNGVDLNQMTEKETAGFRNQKIGFIFQLHHLLPQCTVLENILLPLLPLKNKINANPAIEYAKHLLTRVGLENHLDHKPHELSGGQLQRTAVVRALINKPQVILADEPTGSLDRQTADNLINLLLELKIELNLTLIAATHSEALAGKMNTVYMLRDNRIFEPGKNP